MKTNIRHSLLVLAMCCFVTLPRIGLGASAQQIDIEADAALEKFYKEFPSGAKLVKASKGFLIFPSVLKAGLFIGGEHGEGALRVGGKTVAYYATSAASFGLQAGVQTKSILLVFMTQAALDQFRASNGYEVGVTGSVAVIEQGTGGEIDTSSVKDPIAAFVFGNKGLMVDASLEGSKYTKLNK